MPALNVKPTTPRAGAIRPLGTSSGEQAATPAAQTAPLVSVQALVLPALSQAAPASSQTLPKFNLLQRWVQRHYQETGLLAKIARFILWFWPSLKARFQQLDAQTAASRAPSAAAAQTTRAAPIAPPQARAAAASVAAPDRAQLPTALVVHVQMAAAPEPTAQPPAPVQASTPQAQLQQATIDGDATDASAAAQQEPLPPVGSAAALAPASAQMVLAAPLESAATEALQASAQATGDATDASAAAQQEPLPPVGSAAALAPASAQMALVAPLESAATALLQESEQATGDATDASAAARATLADEAPERSQMPATVAAAPSPQAKPPAAVSALTRLLIAVRLKSPSTAAASALPLSSHDELLERTASAAAPLTTRRQRTDSESSSASDTSTEQRSLSASRDDEGEADALVPTARAAAADAAAGTERLDGERDRASTPPPTAPKKRWQGLRNAFSAIRAVAARALAGDSDAESDTEQA